MTKYYCDRCEKEITLEEHKSAMVREAMRAKGYDFVGGCHHTGLVA